MQGLGRPGNELMAAAGMYGVSWFVRLFAAKGSKMMTVLSTIEAQLSLHKCNTVKAAPEAWELQEPGG